MMWTAHTAEGRIGHLRRCKTCQKCPIHSWILPLVSLFCGYFYSISADSLLLLNLNLCFRSACCGRNFFLKNFSSFPSHEIVFRPGSQGLFSHFALLAFRGANGKEARIFVCYASNIILWCMRRAGNLRFICKFPTEICFLKLHQNSLRGRNGMWIVKMRVSDFFLPLKRLCKFGSTDKRTLFPISVAYVKKNVKKIRLPKVVRINWSVS